MIPEQKTDLLKINGYKIHFITDLKTGKVSIPENEGDDFLCLLNTIENNCKKRLNK